MSTDRNRRKLRQGIVVSTAGEKTCVVKVEERKKHALYGKMITQSTKFHTHDQTTSAASATPSRSWRPVRIKN